MARGKKYNDDIKERAYALLAVNNSTSFVAEQLEIPRTTVKSWKEAYDKHASDNGEDTIAELRQKKRMAFVDRAWNIIDKSEMLIEKRLDRVVRKEELIDKLLMNGALSDEERKALASCKRESTKDLATVLGTMYDKQALANKEATAIVNGNINTTIKFEDL